MNTLSKAGLSEDLLRTARLAFNTSSTSSSAQECNRSCWNGASYAF